MTRPPMPPAGPAAPARRPSQRARNPGLDGLRAVAALFVFFFHIYLYQRGDRATEAWEQIPLQFSTALIFFFVLSGYLLYLPWARAAAEASAGPRLAPYVARRAARILPAYYVCLVAVYPLLRSIDGEPGVRLPDPDRLWTFALLLQNYWSDTVLQLNPVTWTLPVEVAFYALLPALGLFVLRASRGRRTPQVVMAGGLIAGGLVWNAVVHIAGLDQTFGKALPGFLPYFALGILAALFTDRRARAGRPLLGGTATTALVAAGIGLMVVEGCWHALARGAPPFTAIAVTGHVVAATGFALIMVAVAVGTGKSIGWASSRPLVFLGEISYGFFLWHVPLILYVQHLGLRDDGYLTLTAVVLALAIAAATASWYLVERPLIALAHARAAPRRAAAADGA